MLQKLVAEIDRGGPLETESLAKRLGTTAQMVSAMLEHLEALGMVSSKIECTDGCGGCSLRDGCKSAAEVRLWQARVRR